MRNPLSDKIVDIKPSGIRKFFDIVSEMEDAISLGVGEPDFDTPWHIRDEGIYSLEKGRTFYTSNAGLKELKVEICNYLKRRFDLTYDYAKEVLVTVGGSEAIDIALRTMVNPGDEVLIPQPSYVSYEPCAILADAVPVIINLKAENEFRLTAQELRDAITDKTKVLVLPFPNNPTGAIMEREDLEAIAEVILEKDLFVISDEIYGELTYKEDHVSIANIPGMQERTILINGFSKSYAMTGWRLGYACGPSVIIEQMLKIHQFAIMCAPTTSQYAAVEALRNGERGQTPWTPAVNTLLEINARLRSIEARGIDAERAEIASRAKAVRDALTSTTLEMVPENPSNAVTALRCPASNAKAIIERAKTGYGMWLCPNGGALCDEVFRIGHIGAITEEDNDRLIDCLTSLSAEGLF